MTVFYDVGFDVFGGVCAIAGAAMKVAKATRVAKVFMSFSIVRKSDATLLSIHSANHG